MDKLAEIKQNLLSGQQPIDLIKAGYAKSSVYYMMKKIRDTQMGISELPGDDELADLRRQREVLKLEKEIADIEAAKEKLPDRMAVLEKKVAELQATLHETIDWIVQEFDLV